MRIRHIISLSLGIFLSLQASAWANNAHLNNDLCYHATRQMEQQFNIPLNLLRAISITESGRWNRERKANVAWPWTVASGAAGDFFPTKAAAIAHVRTLQAKGVKNIDVGCMQINLRYHPDAFQSLEQAFDPYHNAQYAATFLSKLFKKTHSWTAAAGHYHSSDPQRNMYYKEKVIGYWNHANTQNPTVEKKRTTTVASAAHRIDKNRMQQLNQAFKSRVQSQRQPAAHQGEVSQQLLEWRNAVDRSQIGQISAARNRALRMKAEKDSLAVPEITARTALSQRDFSQRRNQQLDKWRRTIAKPELLAQTP